MTRDALQLYHAGVVLPGTFDTLEDSPRRLILAGAAIAALFFVGFLGWAAVARLDASAVGTGRVAVAGNRQTVQHRDGGIVAQLDVREGARVTAGQILIRLAGDEVLAQERSLAASVIALLAQQARLEAELSDTRISWPDSFATARPEDRDLVARAKALQLRQYALRRGSLDAAHQIMQSQQASLVEQSRGFRAQSDAADRQRQSMQQQLDATRDIAAKGYVSKNSVRQLERGIAELGGNAADYGARVAAAHEQIGEVRKEYLQTERKSSEDAATTLRDTQAQLNDQSPRLEAAREQFERLLIRAPATGRVIGLKIFTVGAVVRAGEPIMDVVPERAPLIIKANFAPSDIDGVRAGAAAEIKFGSLHERDLPIVMGRVESVSADTLTDEKTGQSYYTADLIVPEREMDRLRAARGQDSGVRAGVPVQAFVRLKTRTALDYLLEPLTEMLARSFHER